MKTKSIIISVNLLLSCLINGQDYKRQAYEQIAYSVVYLEREVIERVEYNDSIHEVWLKPLNKDTIYPKINKFSGTGSIVKYDNYYFLVTAKHVADIMSLDSKVYFSNKNNLPYVIELGDMINYEPAGWNINEESDLAVLMISPTKEFYDSLKLIYIPQSIIQTKKESPARETDVTIIGFPLGLGIQGIFSPITKATNPASDFVTIKDPKTKKEKTYFLLSDPSTSGFSGAPVFQMPTTRIEKNFTIITSGGPTLLGLISSTLYDETGGKFAAVVPSYLIYETLKSARCFNVKFIYRYNNGKLWRELIFKNGKPWTVISNYDLTGKPQKKGTLKNGNGTLYEYDEGSNLLRIEEYKNGEKNSANNIR